MSKAFIQRAAPFFKANAWNFKTQQFQQLQLTDYKGKYLLFFFYPLNFTFVCPTEIIEFSKKAAEFREYTMKSRADGGLGGLDIPLLADTTKQISSDYGVLLDAGIALRGSFIIDTNQVLRHMSINDLPVGRNVDEYLRLVQAFQFADQNGEVCPASWKPGSETIKPDVNKAEEYWKNVHAKK